MKRRWKFEVVREGGKGICTSYPSAAIHDKARVEWERGKRGRIRGKEEVEPDGFGIGGDDGAEFVVGWAVGGKRKRETCRKSSSFEYVHKGDPAILFPLRWRSHRQQYGWVAIMREHYELVRGREKTRMVAMGIKTRGSTGHLYAASGLRSHEISGFRELQESRIFDSLFISDTFREPVALTWGRSSYAALLEGVVLSCVKLFR
jgi:hypothetical protein